MRLVWLSDLHLDHLEVPARRSLAERVLATRPDRVVVTGDITHALRLEQDLGWLGAALGCPVDFVLGNHDYYKGQMGPVGARVRALVAHTPTVRWLDDLAGDAAPLTGGWSLVGCGGWGDGRLGRGQRSPLRLNDHLLIGDLAGLEQGALFERLAALGDAAAEHLRRALPVALERSTAGVVVATHVPPFRAACWHQGEISGDDWLPHFACKATGDVLAAAARSRPDRQFIVLCGHTHGAGEAQILPNLHVRTAGTDYGLPRVEGVLDVEGDRLVWA